MISFLSVLTTGLLLYLGHLFFKYHKVKNVPAAHTLSHFSTIWLRMCRKREVENKSIHGAHAKLGPIIRLAANEVHVNTVKDGVDLVYGGNYDKDAYYSKYENFGRRNMFSELRRDEHLQKRKVLNNFYSKSYIIKSTVFHSIMDNKIFEQLLGALRVNADREEVVDVLELFSASAMDCISAWIFGIENGTDFINDAEARQQWTDADDDDDDHSSLTATTEWLKTLFDGIRTRVTGDQPIQDEPQEVMVRQLYEKTSRQASSSHGPVFAKLQQSSKDQSDTTAFDADIASEMMDHLIAGNDTTAITLLYIIYNLSSRPALQTRLRSTIPPSPGDGVTEEYLRILDNEPLVDAIINETMRLHAPVPGRQLRVVPPQGAKIAGQWIPGGTKISASAYSLHRNDKVFPGPEKWGHHRWLDADESQRREMDRWFWGWGSGVRMCIGKAFATLEMKSMLAVVYANFTTEIVDGDGIEQEDGYAAGPRGKITVRFSRVQDR